MKSSFLKTKTGSHEPAFEALFENQDIGVAIVTPVSLVFERVNTRFESLAGNTAGGLFGCPVSPVIESLFNTQVSELIERACNEGESNYLHELLCRPAARQNFQYFNLLLQPVKDAKGSVSKIVLLAFDVSEEVFKRRLEHDSKSDKQLRQVVEESKLQSRIHEVITDSTPDLVYAFDLNARFTFANKALLTMWGRSREDSLGKTLIEVGYEPWHAEMHEKEIEHIIKTRQTVRGEVAFPHATLGQRIYDYIFVPVLDAEGNVTAIAGTTRDITEIKALSRQKDEFLAIASHELKTPVTSIKAYGQVLQAMFERKNDAMAVGALKKMDSQVNKLTGLISDLLDVTKMQTGKIAFDEEQFDLGKLVTETVEELQLTSQKHTITTRLPPGVVVRGDRERIGQVVTNLVSNAIKYSPQADLVEVDLNFVDQQAVISVTDHGIGIPVEMQSRVFERFYRVSGAHSTIPGMGIGLYISSEIARRIGGQIWLESTPGKGSTFYFSLPYEGISEKKPVMSPRLS